MRKEIYTSDRSLPAARGGSIALAYFTSSVSTAFAFVFSCSNLFLWFSALSRFVDFAASGLLASSTSSPLLRCSVVELKSHPISHT